MADAPLWLALCAGSAGGFCNTISGYPLDTVKVRLQTGNTQNLFRGVFKGMSAPIASVVPFWAASYFGYRVGRSLRPDEGLVPALRGGMCAGVVGSVIWCPMQAVKCVAQDRRCTSFQALDFIRGEKGLSGLYRGYFTTLLLFSIPGSTVFYGTYDTSSRYFGNAWWVPFLSGGLAGCLEWTVGMPGDTVRTRYQTGLHYKNARECARELLRTDGLPGLYRGFSAALARAFVCNGAALLGIEGVYYAYRSYTTSAPDQSSGTSRSKARQQDSVGPMAAIANVSDARTN